MVLEEKAFHTTAVIKADERDEKIYTYVAGEQKRDYFSAIRKTFRDINASFEKLEAKEMVPLPDNVEITIEYEELLGYEQMGEDNYIVGKLRKTYRVKELLKERDISLFYDSYEKADLWGKDLYQHLQSVYRGRSQFCVVFLSRAYAKKLWTRHELKQAQARAFLEHKEYILPVRIDDTEIPGINETIGYIDLRSTPLEKIADLLVEKLSS